MNKKAEDYLFKKGLIAKNLLVDKKYHEEQIAKELKLKREATDLFTRGLHAGLVIGHKMSARNCKIILKQILKEEYEKERWKQRYMELNRYVELKYKDYA